MPWRILVTSIRFVFPGFSMPDLDMSLGERLLYPAGLTIFFALMSGGAIVGLGGDTPGMKIVLRCAIVFIAGVTYAIMWQDKLANIFGWDDAWIAAIALAALASIWLGRRWFAKLST